MGGNFCTGVRASISKPTGIHQKSGAFHILFQKNGANHILFAGKKGPIIYLAALKKGAIWHAHP